MRHNTEKCSLGLLLKFNMLNVHCVSFFSVRAATCTNAGCLVSQEYGPFQTKAIRKLPFG